MRLGKRARIFLAGGIFVVLMASLFLVYAQHNQERNRLSDELSLVQLALTRFSPEKLSAQQRVLESRLTRTELELATAKNRLRQSIESIEVTDTLFEVADTHNVEIIGIDSPGVTGEELEGVNLSILSLTAMVEGDVSNLVDFIIELSEEFPTSVDSSVEILFPTSVDESEETDVEKPIASIELRIHTYEGD
ncbi:hypothetical protein ES703_112830 [subsurface metagenome]